MNKYILLLAMFVANFAMGMVQKNPSDFLIETKNGITRTIGQDKVVLSHLNETTGYSFQCRKYTDAFGRSAFDCSEKRQGTWQTIPAGQAASFFNRAESLFYGLLPRE